MGAGAERPLEASLRLDWPIDALATLGPLWQGPGDAQMHIAGRIVLRASETAAGPAGVRLEFSARHVAVQAWGPGRALAIAALPDLLGARDQPELLVPRHHVVSQLVRRNPGLRLPRSGQVMGALVPAVIAQKVSGSAARASYRRLVARLGRPAPGPLGLRLAPSPAELAAAPYWVFHELDVEQRRAASLRAAACVAARLEAITELPSAEARQRLLAVPGVGPWTAAETMRVALGDADAVSVGDYNLPHLVSWLLAGEARADDARMLELLEPYRGQRARVVRLLELSGQRPPRFGPRLARRSISRL